NKKGKLTYGIRPNITGKQLADLVLRVAEPAPLGFLVRIGRPLPRCALRDWICKSASVRTLSIVRMGGQLAASHPAVDTSNHGSCHRPRCLYLDSVERSRHEEEPFSQDQYRGTRYVSTYRGSVAVHR